jgi:thermitase
MKRNFLYVLVPLLVLLFGVIHANAFEVMISGDKLTVRANEVPLQSLLQRLADLGIKIRIDPEINPKITASFQDRDIRQGLASILKPFDHVLFWVSIEGPAGPMPELAEIQVFKPGKKERMEPLGPKTRFDIARNPEEGSFFVKNEILLGLNPGMTLSEFKALLRQFGGTVVDSYPAVGIYKIRLPEGTDVPSLVEQITRHPKVAKAEPNYAYLVPPPYRQTGSDTPPPESGNIPASRDTVPVAVLDTGLGPYSGVEDLVLASLDALDPDAFISDSLGHGTQMALIAAGVVKPTGAKSESGTQSPIIPIRVFDDNGYTSNFTIMSSIEFALKHGARVMSLSWGSETRSDFLESALNDARSKGLIIVASVGNEPTGKPIYPAAFPSVIGVGALAPDGKSWENSNYGDFVSLYAPGFASLPVGYKGEPGPYAGTSISAAYAANVIADYLSEHPEAATREVLEALGRR